MMHQRPRGTKDILQAEALLRRNMLDKAMEILQSHGYFLVELPVFERTQLFTRSIGQITDIVEKEMFTFSKGDESYALRPEGTAGAVRAFIEARAKIPFKMAYWGPLFRAERPQKGRLRQFTQLGIEAFGPSSPQLDAEQIYLAVQVLRAWGLRGIKVLLNSIGCPDDRQKYKDQLLKYLEPKKHLLCPDCQRRMTRNPVRVLDCKRDAAKIKDAPRITEYLCQECLAHYNGVKAGLKDMGVDFVEEPGLWRGLDYYTKTVFEIRAEGLGAQDAVGGGGRYDLLVEQLGGSPTPASGWAIGVERAQIAMEAAGTEKPHPRPEFFVITMGQQARVKGLELVRALRAKGVWTEYDYDDSKLSKQFKLANRSNARYALIIGEDELKTGSVKRKDLDTGQESLIPFEELLKAS